METEPMKSPSMHNFSFPCLKWGNKNQVNNGNRFGKSPESVSEVPSPNTHHPIPGYVMNTASSTEKESGLNRFSLLSCSKQKQDGFDVEESSGRQWNLRARKVALVETGIVSKKGVDDDGGDRMIEMTGGAKAIAPPQTENQPKSMRLRGLMAEGGYGMDRRVKRKFWIALSRDEIEEDIYAMTGLRPSRRPKKRPKNVQKQLDNVFPGLHFVGLSSDAYKVNQTLR